MRRRIYELRRICAIILLAIMSQPNTAAADKALVAEISANIAREAGVLQEQGYRRVLPEIIVGLERDQRRSFRLHLEAEATYAIVGTCDNSCTHVELTLYDAQRAALARSPEVSSTVILNGAAGYTGQHEAEISIPGCSKPACHIGLVVLRSSKSR
jgi:hypothetical protein